MIMTRFAQAVDPHHNAPITSIPPTAVDSLICAANVARRYTLPEGTAFVMVVGDLDVVVLAGDVTVTATIPTGDVLTGLVGMYNPALMTIPPGVTHLSIISPLGGIAYVHRWTK